VVKTIINRTWSEEHSDYMILGATLTLKVAELLLVTKALRMVAEDKNSHPDDRAKAEKMLKEIHERLGE